MMNRNSERWEALIERDCIDGLLQEVTIRQAAETWHRYHHRKDQGADEDSDPDWWAIELWWGIGRTENEDLRRTFITELVDSAVTEADIGMVGAGPIEDFIPDDEDRLAWLEQQAARSIQFRRALANVYVWGSESDAVAERLERAAGTRLPRPRGWTGP